LAHVGSQRHEIRQKTGDVCINVTLRLVLATIVVVEEAISITYSECVSVTLVIQHAVRMRRITVSILARPALQFFFTLS
jgi:hypothetical protein